MARTARTTRMARMARPAGLVLLTALLGLAMAACTFLSGVEGFDLRRGGGAEAGDASGSDFDATEDAPSVRTDASSSGAVDATVPTGDAACATAAECQEQRCRNDVFVTDRIEAEIGKVLAVTATCTASAPRVISPGPNHYYGADLRCTLAPQPTAAALSSFQTKMNADGWYGYTTQSSGADVVVVGMATTRLCNTY